MKLNFKTYLYKQNTMITLLVIIVVLGVLLYIVSLIPMNDTFKKIVYALAILFALLYILQYFGLFNLPK